MAEDAKNADGGGQKHRFRFGGFSIWNAVLGTALAIIGVVIAYEQARLGTVENQATQQQSLVALVTDIANLEKSEVTAPSDQIASIHEAAAADAAQGIALVDALHNRVPAIDNVELGAAFEDSREFHLALVSFARAATVTADPFYRSKALRAVVAILYYIGGRNDDLKAQTDTVQAYHSFDNQPDVPDFQRDNNRELVLLWDARWGASFDCSRAQNEVGQSRHLIASDPASSDPAVTEDVTAALDAVRYCTGGGPRSQQLPYVPVS